MSQAGTIDNIYSYGRHQIFRAFHCDLEAFFFPSFLQKHTRMFDEEKSMIFYARIVSLIWMPVFCQSTPSSDPRLMIIRWKDVHSFYAQSSETGNHKTLKRPLIFSWTCLILLLGKSSEPDHGIHVPSVAERRTICDRVLTSKIFVHVSDAEDVPTMNATDDVSDEIVDLAALNYQRSAATRRHPNPISLSYVEHTVRVGSSDRQRIRAFPCLNTRADQWYVTLGSREKDEMFLLRPYRCRKSHQESVKCLKISALLERCSSFVALDALALQEYFGSQMLIGTVFDIIEIINVRLELVGIGITNSDCLSHEDRGDQKE
jgi:hypothetical protein